MIVLAQFIMSSRIKASIAACLGNLLPFFSPAVVALVTLRKGFAEGLLVLLWAALPLGLMLYIGNVNPMMVWASLASIVVVFFASVLLKDVASWQYTLLVVIALSALSMAVIGVGMDNELGELRAGLAEMLMKMQQQGQLGEAGSHAGLEIQLGDNFILGLLAWVIAVGAVGSLLLGRWWQALLYNPGGFAVEFQALRMGSLPGPLLAVGMIACYLASTDYAAWGNLLGLPLLVAGLALIHHLVARAKIGKHWLAIFYICLVFLLGPLSMMLVGLGLVDSVVNLRSRWAKKLGDLDN